MPSEKISFGEDGSFRWTIQNFREMRKIHYNHLFTYKGVDYSISSMKLVRPSRINVKFGLMYAMFDATKYIPLNGMSGTFKLLTDCNNESNLHVSTWNDQTFCFEATINMEEFLPQNRIHTESFYDIPFPKQLTILFWMRDVNGKGENVSENANKPLDEEKNSEYDTLKKLQKDFEKLFLSKEDADVTLEVHQEKFLAHRAILRARSPVFYSMFSHEMSETRSGVVTISDCDPKTFPDFLRYMYTGNTQHISEKNVCHLYTMSDKYEVEELKRKCSEFMKSHISVETFCDFISLALKHSEDDLIRTSTDFFCRSAVEIAKTVKWQKFLQENSTVGNELFQKALLKRNNI